MNEIFIRPSQIHPIKVVLNGRLISTNEFANLNFENSHTYNQGYEKLGLSGKKWVRKVDKQETMAKFS